MSVKLVLLNYVLLVIFGEINCPGVFKSYQSQDGQGDSRDLDEIEAGQNVQFIEQRLTSKGPEREYLDLDKFQSFIVSVQTSENGVRKICSGSVLTRNTVLCPAHCVCYNNTDQPLPIRQITIMQQIHNEFVETEVKSVQIHSEYYSYLYQHDLAILEAEEALLVVQDVDDEGNLAVAPRVTVNLASEEIYRGSTPEEVFNTGCWSVGWFLVEGSLKSVEYKAWPVYLMSQQECQKAWTDAEEMIFVTSSHVCTHNVNQVIVGQDIGRNAKTSNGCNRNLGDVLMCNNVQIAVKTNGGTDCFDRKPTLWTRVDKTLLIHLPKSLKRVKRFKTVWERAKPGESAEEINSDEEVPEIQDNHERDELEISELHDKDKSSKFQQTNTEDNNDSMEILEKLEKIRNIREEINQLHEELPKEISTTQQTNPNPNFYIKNISIEEDKLENTDDEKNNIADASLESEETINSEENELPFAIDGTDIQNGSKEYKNDNDDLLDSQKLAEDDINQLLKEWEGHKNDDYNKYTSIEYYKNPDERSGEIKLPILIEDENLSANLKHKDYNEFQDFSEELNVHDTKLSEVKLPSNKDQNSFNASSSGDQKSNITVIQQKDLKVPEEKNETELNLATNIFASEEEPKAIEVDPPNISEDVNQDELIESRIKALKGIAQKISIGNGTTTEEELVSEGPQEDKVGDHDHDHESPDDRELVVGESRLNSNKKERYPSNIDKILVGERKNLKSHKKIDGAIDMQMQMPMQIPHSGTLQHNNFKQGRLGVIRGKKIHPTKNQLWTRFGDHVEKSDPEKFKYKIPIKHPWEDISVDTDEENRHKVPRPNYMMKPDKPLTRPIQGQAKKTFDIKKLLEVKPESNEKDSGVVKEKFPIYHSKFERVQNKVKSIPFRAWEQPDTDTDSSVEKEDNSAEVKQEDVKENVSAQKKVANAEKPEEDVESQQEDGDEPLDKKALSEPIDDDEIGPGDLIKLSDESKGDNNDSPDNLSLDLVKPLEKVWKQIKGSEYKSLEQVGVVEKKEDAKEEESSKEDEGTVMEKSVEDKRKEIASRKSSRKHQKPKKTSVQETETVEKESPKVSGKHKQNRPHANSAWEIVEVEPKSKEISSHEEKHRHHKKNDHQIRHKKDFDTEVKRGSIVSGKEDHEPKEETTKYGTTKKNLAWTRIGVDDIDAKDNQHITDPKTSSVEPKSKLRKKLNEFIKKKLRTTTIKILSTEKVDNNEVRLEGHTPVFDKMLSTISVPKSGNSSTKAKKSTRSSLITKWTIVHIAVGIVAVLLLIIVLYK